MDLIVLRLLFVALLAIVCYFLHPFGVENGLVGAAAGAGAAGAVIVFELRVRALSLRRLIGAVFGSVLGIFGAALFCLVLRSAPLNTSSSAVLQIFVLLLMTYVGLLVGASKGDLLNPAALGTIFAADRPSRRSAKVLDTSVIIDGRIADIAEAGFIDGMIVVPEFGSCRLSPIQPILPSASADVVASTCSSACSPTPPFRSRSFQTISRPSAKSISSCWNWQKSGKPKSSPTTST